jgi:hypothetical protein
MLQDFRYAHRVLSQNKAWTAMVVLTISLGIGANTALFTAVNGFFLRKLSVDDPDTLVRLKWTGPNDIAVGQSVYGRTNPEGGVDVQPNFSYPMFQELRKSNQNVSLRELITQSEQIENRFCAGTIVRARLRGFRRAGAAAGLDRPVRRHVFPHGSPDKGDRNSPGAGG